MFKYLSFTESFWKVRVLSRFSGLSTSHFHSYFKLYMYIVLMWLRSYFTRICHQHRRHVWAVLAVNQSAVAMFFMSLSFSSMCSTALATSWRYSSCVPLLYSVCYFKMFPCSVFESKGVFKVLPLFKTRNRSEKKSSFNRLTLVLCRLVSLGDGWLGLCCV